MTSGGSGERLGKCIHRSRIGSRAGRNERVEISRLTGDDSTKDERRAAGERVPHSLRQTKQDVSHLSLEWPQFAHDASATSLWYPSMIGCHARRSPVGTTRSSHTSMSNAPSTIDRMSTGPPSRNTSS